MLAFPSFMLCPALSSVGPLVPVQSQVQRVSVFSVGCGGSFSAFAIPSWPQEQMHL